MSRPPKASPSGPRRALSGAKERLPDSTLLLETLPTPVLLIGAHDDILFVNSEAESFFARSRTLLTRETLQAVAAADHPVFLLLQQVRQTGNTVTEHGINLSSPRFHHDGVTVQGSAIAEFPGQVLLLIQDGSSTKVLDRQLAFRSAARSVSGMAAILAHEIKNPLSGIRGAAQLLEGSVNVNDRELAVLIRDEADRIRALVDRMEMFSEKPEGRRPVNIHRVLEHVRTLAENGVAKGIPIVERYDPSLPPVWGNRDELVQVLLNLIKNAAEAIQGTGEPGTITLITAYKQGLRLAVPGTERRRHLPLVVTVRDSGPGFAEAIRPHLFEPFLTTKTAGSGLGLALAGKIINDHDGVIEVESRPGCTEIRLHLPVVVEEGGAVP
ncbi:two-component system sensor histidine kinase NtrB [Acetobacter conturbans]|uniref:histidine kinase n=1 Tax=Acetobacter conturbans TaxID=1737472 RepID=A0ABX0JXD6_9PROT|nr:ATP-binding protein [Acetobacter conturbans]NHN88157.1 two-component sensor histidine kinase [Acetobacter conturbans]